MLRQNAYFLRLIFFIGTSIGCTAGFSQSSGSDRFATLISKADTELFRNPKNSLQQAVEAYVLAEQLSSDSLKALANNRIGVAHTMLGNTDAALDSLESSRQEATNSGYASLNGKNLSEIGNIYNMAGFGLSAIDYYRVELEIQKGLQEPERLLVVNKNIGRAYLDIQYYDSALKYFERAAEFLGSSMPLVQPVLTLHMAETYFLKGEESKSLELLAKAFGEAEELQNQFALGYAHRLKSEWLLQTGQIIEATLHGREALKIAENLSSKALVSDCNKTLSRCLGEQGLYEEAFKRNKLYEQHRDSVQSIETKGELAMLSYYQRLFRFRVLEERNTQNARLAQERKFIIFSLIAVLVLAVFFLVIIVQNRKQIEKQNQELKRLNQFKAKLFAVVSHDLRSPMTAAVNVVNLLSHKLLSREEIEPLLPEITEKTSNLLDLLNNIFHWAEGQMDTKEIEIVSFPIIEVLSELRTELDDRLKEKNIELLYAEGNEMVLQSNPGFLRVILRNLVVNAIKFSDPGMRVKIECEQQAEKTTIAVSDRGMGMSKSQIDNLFTADVTSTVGTAGERGTGLGLNLCVDFAQRLGGDIEVKSIEGKGSTFSLVLPN